jgi:hypothetical protein
MDRFDEPSNDNEERPMTLCPDCGADHEVEPCAPGCHQEGPMAFNLRTHPRRQEINELATDLQKAGLSGLLTRVEAIGAALSNMGLDLEAGELYDELDRLATRRQENLAGVHGRGPQDHARQQEAADATIASVDAQHQALVHPDGSACPDGCDAPAHPDAIR